MLTTPSKVFVNYSGYYCGYNPCRPAHHGIKVSYPCSFLTAPGAFYCCFTPFIAEVKGGIVFGCKPAVLFLHNMAF